MVTASGRIRRADDAKSGRGVGSVARGSAIRSATRAVGRRRWPVASRCRRGAATPIVSGMPPSGSNRSTSGRANLYRRARGRKSLEARILAVDEANFQERVIEHQIASDGTRSRLMALDEPVPKIVQYGEPPPSTTCSGRQNTSKRACRFRAVCRLHCLHRPGCALALGEEPPVQGLRQKHSFSTLSTTWGICFRSSDNSKRVNGSSCETVLGQLPMTSRRL